MECLLPYLSMVTVPHIMVRLERMLDYRGIRLERFHRMYLCCSFIHTYVCAYIHQILVKLLYYYSIIQYIIIQGC